MDTVMNVGLHKKLAFHDNRKAAQRRHTLQVQWNFYKSNFKGNKKIFEL
jgi:hypothetical protein